MYEGVKFDTKFLKKEEISHDKIIDLISYCNQFGKNNFAPSYDGGSYGNLSCRVKENSDDFIITASHTSLTNIKLERLIRVKKCNINKKIIEVIGLHKPSSETMLHDAIYKQRPEINAIFHGHSEEILNIAKEKNIISTKKEIPYGTVELVKATLDILDKNNFFILKNHGFFSLGKTMKEAWENIMK